MGVSVRPQSSGGVASSRRSVTQGAAQKTAHEKINKARGEEALPLAPLFYFFVGCFLHCVLSN